MGESGLIILLEFILLEIILYNLAIILKIIPNILL